jgi:hypothetical protein
MSDKFKQAMDETENEAMEIEIVDADNYLTPPPPDDPVLCNLFEMGQKVMVVGPPKTRKSFFTQQLACSISNGLSFLKWTVPKRRKVLLIQFELRGKDCHRRVNKMAEKLGIDSFEGNLKWINARGKEKQVMDSLPRIVENYKPDIIILDPLYKLMPSGENTAEDMKPILALFDKIVEESGAALVFVHHTTKGDQGKKDLVDIGAGSGVLSRDYDTAIILSNHNAGENYRIVDTVIRTYPPFERITIEWDHGIFVNSQLPAADKKPGRKTSDDTIKNEIRQLLKRQPCISKNKIETEFSGVFPKEAIRRIISVMVEDSELLETKRKEKGGGYSYSLPDDVDA